MPSSSNQMMRAWSVGIDFVASVAGGGVLGWLLDWWWGSSPWALLVCLLIGLIVGFYRFLKEAMAANRAFTRSSTPERRSDDSEGSV